MTSPSRPDSDRLIDFVKGRLTPEEGLEVLDWVEKDKETSDNLMIILELQKIPREEWERIRTGGR